MVKAFSWVAVAYGVALAVAVVVGFGVDAEHPIAVAFAADVAGTLVIFAFSFAFRNSSFYDPYWSVAPAAIAVYWIWSADTAAVDPARQILVLALVCVWGARLTYNWARGWGGLHHEDWRYVNLRESSGRAYWGVSLIGLHMIPTLIVFVGCLPLYPALADPALPFGALDGVAAAVTVAAIAIEATADEQLRRFRTSLRDPRQVLSTGLWAYSRHPNYFGEMLFWWGLYLFGLAAAPSYGWAIVGPLAITLMFRFISLPMIETRMRERRPDFEVHARRTSMVIPWFRRP